jgi:membrane protease YdiL (CAAX protease family)
MEEVLQALTDFSDPASLPLLRYFQMMQSAGLFLLPALLAALFFDRHPLVFLEACSGGKGIIYLVVPAILLTSVPFINQMIVWNENMELPSFLAKIEEWMKETEEQNKILSRVFLKMPDTGTFMMNILMIAIIPAISEEFMFRGLLQRLFRDWLKNIHWAVILSSVFFAAMHFQFYGFLPRLLMGVLLGYLLYWTGSIWVPVFAHFINNGAAIVFSFLEQRGVIGENYGTFGSSGNLFIIFTSAMVTGALIWIVRFLSKNRLFTGTGQTNSE